MAVKVRALIILATIVLVNLPTGLVVDAAIHDKQQEPARRRNVNFAFGGATTNSRNAGQFFSEEVNEQVENAGLELIGVTQQLEWLDATLDAARASGRPVWLVMHAPPGGDLATTGSENAAGMKAPLARRGKAKVGPPPAAAPPPT